jgi:hypothetical protein
MKTDSAANQNPRSTGNSLGATLYLPITGLRRRSPIGPGSLRRDGSFGRRIDTGSSVQQPVLLGANTKRPRLIEPSSRRPNVQSVGPNGVRQGSSRAAESSFFSLITPEVLTSATKRYQALGCWNGGIVIPRDLYEQALNVFKPLEKSHCAPSL